MYPAQRPPNHHTPVCNATRVPPPSALRFNHNYLFLLNYFLPAGATAGSSGNHKTTSAFTVAIPAMIHSSVANPTLFTMGPSYHTAAELKPNATVSRMPATRERSRSST